MFNKAVKMIVSVAITLVLTAILPVAQQTNAQTVPDNLVIGIINEDNLADIQAAGVDYRYQYLAGGVNTGDGWATAWGSTTFAADYINSQESAGLDAAFTYYQILQSDPGTGSEANAVLNNLANASTMQAYYADFQELMEQIESTGNTDVIVQFEPDMWGFIQQAATANDPATVTASVSSSGYTGIDMSGYGNQVDDMTQAILAIRDQYAPTTMPAIGYHISTWATGTDIIIQDSTASEIQTLGQQVAAFYNNLGADFDYLFGEFRDRDAGLCENPETTVSADSNCNTGPDSRFTAEDFERHIMFFDEVNDNATNNPPVILWQIPVGDIMRDDSGPGEYSDNIIETLLANDQEVLNYYAEAGVVGLFFGGGCTDCSGPIDYTYDLIEGYTSNPLVLGAVDTTGDPITAIDGDLPISGMASGNSGDDGGSSSDDGSTSDDSSSSSDDSSDSSDSSGEAEEEEEETLTETGTNLLPVYSTVGTLIVAGAYIGVREYKLK